METDAQKIERLERELEELKTIVFAVIKVNSIVFEKDIVIASPNGVRVGISTDKLGFFGATPVAQQASITDADGTLASATSRVNAILDVLDALGFTA